MESKENGAKEVPLPIVKTLILGAVGIAAATLVSFFLSRASEAADIRSMLFAAGAVLVWLAVLLIQYVTVAASRVALSVLFLESATLLIFLTKGASLYLLVAAGVVFVFLALGFWRARTDLESVLKIRFWRTGFHAISAAVTGFALFLTIYGIGLVDVSRLYLPKRMADALLKSAAPVAARFIPNFSPTLSVAEFLRTAAVKKFPDATPAELDLVIRNATKEIEKALKANVNVNDTISDLIYRAANQGLAKLPESSKPFVLLGLGALIFIAIKGVAFFVNWIVVFMAFLLYQALLVFGFIYIGYETRNKELIVLK